jgi:hypothetical protein
VTFWITPKDRIAAVFDDPALAALARHCEDPAVVVDWLLEFAATPDQLRLAAALESLTTPATEGN